MGTQASQDWALCASPGARLEEGTLCEKGLPRASSPSQAGCLPAVLPHIIRSGCGPHVWAG